MRKLSVTAKENLKGWGLLTPSLIFMMVFTVYPILKSIWLSFNRLELGMKAPEFIGIQNYITLMESELFWKVMKNSISFSFMTVIPCMIIALLIALVLNKTFRGVGFLRTIYFYPVVIPMIAIASVWMYIYMPQSGILDKLLREFGIALPNLLGTEKTVLPAMAIMYIWKEVGYLMIFFLSGLQGVPEELYEAAKIDGASWFVTFKSITIPMLMPTILFVSTIALTNSFKLVDHIIVMTEGMPNNSSTLLLYYIYQNGFNFFDQGMASTLTVVMLVIMMAIAMLQFIYSDKKIHYS